MRITTKIDLFSQFRKFREKKFGMLDFSKDIWKLLVKSIEMADDGKQFTLTFFCSSPNLKIYCGSLGKISEGPCFGPLIFD